MSKKEYNNYFPHDSNARNSDELIRLRMRHHSAGYGIYFMILERLREEPDYMSTKDYNVIAFDLREDAALVKSVVEDFGLFTFTDDGKRFYSESFMRRMKVKDEHKRRNAEKAVSAANARWGGDSPKPAQKQQRKKQTPTAPKASTTPTPPVVQYEPVCGAADNQRCLERFFAASQEEPLRLLCKNIGLGPDGIETLRKEADAIINSWNLSSHRHDGYTDWSQHLIATLRIRLKSSNNVPNVRPESTDYTFDGGFGGQDT